MKNSAKNTRFEILGSKGQVIAVLRVKKAVKVARTPKVKADKVVTVTDIKNRWDMNRAVDYKFDADINLTKKTIVISGYHIHNTPCKGLNENGQIVVMYTEEREYFSKSFQLNDHAIYDSYNLIYTAPITNVTASYIEFTTNAYQGTKKRLKLAEFIRRNYKLDLAKVAAENAETRMYI